MARTADRRTKIELLRAAEAVFAEHGLFAARVEDITARAGISKGAFYLHFSSKEDCWRQLVEGFLARLAAEIQPPVGEEGFAGLSAEALRAILHAHDVKIFEFCWENRAFLRMLIGGGGGALYSYLVDEFAERAAADSASWIRRGVASGLYRADADPDIVAELVSGGYDRLVRKLIREAKRPDIEGWCAQAIDLYMEGLRTRSGEVAAATPRVSDPRVSTERTRRVAK